jgi:hypothetical protein
MFFMRISIRVPGEGRWVIILCLFTIALVVICFVSLLTYYLNK